MLSIHLVSIMMWILLYRLATALRMRPNHEYWCKCTCQTNGINKTATCDRLDHCWHRTGIELVFKSLDCFTVRLFHNATIFLLQHIYLLSETFFTLCVYVRGGGGVGGLPRFGGGARSSNVFTIWCRILISRPPMVFRCFKRRSCFFVLKMPSNHIHIQ